MHPSVRTPRGGPRPLARNARDLPHRHAVREISYASVYCLSSRPSPITEKIHRIAAPMVSRSRFFSTTVEPPSDDETPPPNMFDRPPPFPRCSRIRTIRITLVSTSRMLTAVVTGGLLGQPYARVEHAVQDVGQQVGEGDDERRRHHATQKDRQVLGEARLDRLRPDAWQAEQPLGDDRAAEQRAEVAAEQRRDRGERRT